MKLEEALKIGRDCNLVNIGQCSLYIQQHPYLFSLSAKPIDIKLFKDEEITELRKDYENLKRRYSINLETSIEDGLKVIDQYKIDQALEILGDKECLSKVDKALAIYKANSLLSEVFSENSIHTGWITEGLEKGFSAEQIKLYANLDFDCEQVGEIVAGIDSGLTVEQISVYAKAEFNHSQMAQIRLGFETGLSSEEVLKFAKSNLDNQEMCEQRLAALKKLSLTLEDNIFTPQKSERIEINDGKVSFDVDFSDNSDGGCLSGKHKDGYEFLACIEQDNSPFGIDGSRVLLLEIYSSLGLIVVDYDMGWKTKPASEKSIQVFNDVLHSLTQTFKKPSLEKKIHAAKESAMSNSNKSIDATEKSFSKEQIR